MGKKLLVASGVLATAAVAGYVFRDRLLAGALGLVKKANGLIVDDETDDLFIDERGKEYNNQ